MRLPSRLLPVFLRLSLSVLPPLVLSEGHVEQLGGFIGIIDRQTDGSDVLQSLHNKKKME